jgi:hypothetical protein
VPITVGSQVGGRRFVERRALTAAKSVHHIEATISGIAPPDELATTLAADPALRHATDLLVSFVPGVPDFDEHVRLLTATARELR